MFRFSGLAALVAVYLSGGLADAAPVGLAPVAPTARISVSSELTAISQFPDATQEPHIERVLDILLRLNTEIVALAQRPNSAFFTMGGPPEELSAQKRLALARTILRAHGESVVPLLHRHLSAPGEDVQRMGLVQLSLLLPSLPGDLVASEWSLEMSQTSRDLIYRDVAAIFAAHPGDDLGDMSLVLAVTGQASQTPKVRAERALIQLGDARAIALLIEDEPANPTRHYWSISRLALDAPDDAALQKLVPLLASPDADVRFQALYALPSALPAVQTALPRLLDDPDTGVRAFAVFRAFRLAEWQFEALLPRLKSRLADASLTVRLSAAKGFAERKNPIAAPVLLAALRDESVEINRVFYGEILDQLTGFNSGYNGNPPPDDATIKRRNVAAFERIEAWIAEHPGQ